jgi:hypothetical protein
MKAIILNRPCADDAGGYHDTGESLTVPDQVNAERAAALVAEGWAIADPDTSLSKAEPAGANADPAAGEGGTADTATRAKARG